ncbi:MAG: hypothetical protein ACTSW1_07550 [Candidatus Hodarchaeales archaeon]
MLQLTEAEFVEHKDSYKGFCITCNSFTTPEVEPDAEDYDCTECGSGTVMGAEQALLNGHIEFVEEEIPE